MHHAQLHMHSGLFTRRAIAAGLWVGATICRILISVRLLDNFLCYSLFLKWREGLFMYKDNEMASCQNPDLFLRARYNFGQE